MLEGLPESDWKDEDFGIALYCGDCLEILPKLLDDHVDAVVTDPPYGVGLGAHADSRESRVGVSLRRQAYLGYIDSRENLLSIVIPAVRAALCKASRGLVFACGTGMWDYPCPSAVGGVYLPAGQGRTCWGFQNLAHVLLYGQAPQLQLGAKNIVLRSCARAEKSEHPCPKPLPWMHWAVELATRPGELALDPFMGSGTTGVACVRLGRRFIGIEIEPKYFDIAVKRIKKAISEFGLFRQEAVERLKPQKLF